MAADLIGIEEEIEEEKRELVLGLSSKHQEDPQEKEAAGSKEPTVEDLLTAFKDSIFFKRKHFTCPISRDLMLDPVVLNGSGHSVDRGSAMGWIETALYEGKEPTCPINKTVLMKVVWENEAAAPLRPESYFVQNVSLRSLISASIQEFRDSQGNKYKKVPDPMAMVAAKYVLRPEKAWLNEPVNLHPFFEAIIDRPAGIVVILGSSIITGVITCLLERILLEREHITAYQFFLLNVAVALVGVALVAVPAVLAPGGREEAEDRGQGENVGVEIRPMQP
ncbi:MAG: U-box domain [Gammaproteobacteria bacterium]|jgi:hypothetical protein|nr:U-box domain [Gammaproteobacteria bacterium]